MTLTEHIQMQLDRHVAGNPETVGVLRALLEVAKGEEKQKKKVKQLSADQLIQRVVDTIVRDYDGNTMAYYRATQARKEVPQANFVRGGDQAPTPYQQEWACPHCSEKDAAIDNYRDVIESVFKADKKWADKLIQEIEHLKAERNEALAKLAEANKVKPLEWVANDPENSHAGTNEFWYTVTKINEEWAWSNEAHFECMPCDSLEHGQRLAEEHHQARAARIIEEVRG